MTVGEIRQKVRVKVIEHALVNRDKYDVLDKVHKEIRDELIAFYSTPQGRLEINDSPQYHLKTEQAVDLLMKDVDCWINKELGLNAEITE